MDLIGPLAVDPSVAYRPRSLRSSPCTVLSGRIREQGAGNTLPEREADSRQALVALRHRLVSLDTLVVFVFVFVFVNYF